MQTTNKPKPPLTLDAEPVTDEKPETETALTRSDSHLWKTTARQAGPPAGPLSRYSDIDSISELGKAAADIIEARITTLATLRRAAIRATVPEDWLLFRAIDRSTGQETVTGYLQDCGADRVRDLYGIEIFDVQDFERIATEDGAFVYIIRGSGRCAFSRQTLVDVEGGRASTDDFVKDQSGAQLELNVRKAARANLDGNITRELAGLKNVPAQELEAAWEGTSKTLARCRRGRGWKDSPAPAKTKKTKATNPTPPAADPQTRPDCISEAQQRRLFAIAHRAGWTDAEIKAELEQAYGLKTTSAITRDSYEAVVAHFEAGGAPE